MSRLNPTNKQLRNNYIRELYKTTKKKNPKWGFVFIIDEVASKVFLSNATVAKIINEVDTQVPSHVTIIAHTKKMKLQQSA